jgi:hypothetical protein
MIMIIAIGNFLFLNQLEIYMMVSVFLLVNFWYYVFFMCTIVSGYQIHCCFLLSIVASLCDVHTCAWYVDISESLPIFLGNFNLAW